MNLRYAVRTLLRTPGFTAISVLTLALGIGINAVVFSIYESVALKPIAAHAPGELVRITGHQDNQPLETFSYAQFDQIRTQASSLAAVIATSAPQTIVGTLAARPDVLRVSDAGPR